MLKSPVFYALSVGWVAILLYIFRLNFPSVDVGSVDIILSVIGVFLAFITLTVYSYSKKRLKKNGR